jgi:hypothetical protein
VPGTRAKDLRFANAFVDSTSLCVGNPLAVSHYRLRLLPKTNILSQSRSLGPSGARSMLYVRTAQSSLHDFYLQSTLRVQRLARTLGNFKCSRVLILEKEGSASISIQYDLKRSARSGRSERPIQDCLVLGGQGRRLTCNRLGPRSLAKKWMWKLRTISEDD